MKKLVWGLSKEGTSPPPLFKGHLGLPYIQGAIFSTSKRSHIDLNLTIIGCTASPSGGAAHG